MPVVNLQILRGASERQKNQVVADFTASLVSVLGRSPEHIHIVIQEVDRDNWGYAGALMSTRPDTPPNLPVKADLSTSNGNGRYGR